MARFRFGGVDDSAVGDRQYVPAGRYLCEVTQAEDVAKTGKSPYFDIQLTVVEGEHEGLICCYDRLFYASEKALPRVKYVLRNMSFDVDGDDSADIDPEELLHRRVYVETVDDWRCPGCGWSVRPTSRHDEDNEIVYDCSNSACSWEGNGDETKQYTRPKFAGYEPVPPEGVKPAPNQDEIPF